jgi:MFS family permease
VTLLVTERTAPPAYAEFAVRRAKWAVACAFWLNGAGFASWMSRIPAIIDELGLTAGAMGLLLLSVSVGAVTVMPFAGSIVQRMGPRGALTTGVVAVSVGALVMADGLHTHAAATVAFGLFVSGGGMSVWDVAMNVEGAHVERGLRRPLMPRFHAAFSLGVATGAMFAAGAAGVGIGLSSQLAVSAPAIGVGAVFVWRRLAPLTDRPVQPAQGHRLLDALAEPRTLFIGAAVFAFALIEGVANDWLALAVTDGLHTSQWLGSLTFAVFATVMTMSRLSGGWFLQRHRRTAVLRTSATLAATGTLLLVTVTSVVAAIVAAALWGAGAALGFPVGMSAAADSPEHAATRVAAVSTVGYTAFLAGPPLVGMLADAVGVRPALIVVVAAAAAALLTAPATEPLPPAPPPPTTTTSCR